MAKFHFVEDYENLVAHLMQTYPLDEAMSRAVGGGYDLFGKIEAEILKEAGLANGMKLIDLGCGSGRLASALNNDGYRIEYVGIDIIQSLLDYAKVKAPNYKYILHRELSIPQNEDSTDIVCAFSLFTHLLHAESYIYLEECVRVIRPNGKVIFSFLEFDEPYHWDVFLSTKAMTKNQLSSHLNMFIERNAIKIWANKLGLRVDRFIDGTNPIWNGHALGQSVVILQKPE